jgi:K+ transporter
MPIEMSLRTVATAHLSLFFNGTITGCFLVVASRTKSLAILDVASTSEANGQYVIYVQNLRLIVAARLTGVAVTFQNSPTLGTREFIAMPQIMTAESMLPQVMGRSMVDRLEAGTRAEPSSVAAGLDASELVDFMEARLVAALDPLSQTFVLVKAFF